MSSAGAPAGSVFVKRAGDARARFAEVEICETDTVARLAERASRKLDWRTTATYVDLFLVPAESEAAVVAGDDGSEALVLAAQPLSAIRALSAVGIRNRSCLLARLSSPPMSWSRRLCSCLVRPPRTDPLLLAALAQQAAALAQQAAAIEQLPQRIAATLAEAGDLGTIASAVSDPQYEEDSRNWLPSQLLQRCGLVVVENSDLQRTNLVGLQWDFRAPVIMARTEPHPNAELDVFEIFPLGTAAYLRPPPSVEPRYLTPTKFGGAAHPPSAQYFALFEFTTAAKWSKRAKRQGDDTVKTMASRLNERLAKSLDRAKQAGMIPSGARITDLVAVIGVVAPAACTASMTHMMTRGDAPLLLKEMMDARRFVVFVKPRVAQPISSRSSPSEESGGEEIAEPLPGSGVGQK